MRKLKGPAAAAEEEAQRAHEQTEAKVEAHYLVKETEQRDRCQKAAHTHHMPQSLSSFLAHVDIVDTCC